MPKKILFIFNQVRRKQKRGLFRECTLDTDVEAIRKALVDTKYHILSLDLFNSKQLDDFITENYPIDFAFILAEGYKSSPLTLYNGHGATRVREQLKKHNIPFSHSSMETIEICRNKDLTYQKLQESMIPVPSYFVLDTHKRFRAKEILPKIDRIGYPLMVKPAGGGDSIGITPKSVVYNLVELKNKINYLKRSLGAGKIIIEQFLSGQEFTITILGNNPNYILPIVAFPRNWGIRYTETKNKEHKVRNKFKIIGKKDTLFSRLVDISEKSFQAVKANDIIRIDIKKDTKGTLRVIDINGAPSFSVKSSVNFMANKAGLSHSQIIQFVCYEGMIKNNLVPSQYLEELMVPIKKTLAPLQVFV